MPAPAPSAAPEPARLPGARVALILLLAINLFNYIDRYILAAVLPRIAEDSAFAPISKFRLGLLTTAFVASYLALSPVFGWLGDRMSRWLLVGVGVALWSLATGGSGLAGVYIVLLLTRALVGVGEAAYGPVAPSILSDMYPVKMRCWVMAWFYAAIPFGSALGYVVGGIFADSLSLGWRWAFYSVVMPGLLLALWCVFMREPKRGAAEVGGGSHQPSKLRDCLVLARIPSFVCNTIGATGMCFAVGGVAVWMPTYIYEREVTHTWNAGIIARLRNPEEKKPNFLDNSLVKLGLVKAAGLQNQKGAALPDDFLRKLDGVPPTGESLSRSQLYEHLKRHISDEEWNEHADTIVDAARAQDAPKLGTINTIFGGIVAISGIVATLAGGWLGDRLTRRFPGAYFQVSGWAAIAGVPLFILVLFTPFPLAWGFLFLSVIGLFFNTGPSNTVLANVAPPAIRSSAFAINILAIHILGDAISPAIIGFIADHSSLRIGFCLLSLVILASAISWLFGSKHLATDTARAPTMLG